MWASGFFCGADSGLKVKEHKKECDL
jgi:hypothetical protein